MIKGISPVVLLILVTGLVQAAPAYQLAATDIARMQQSINQQVERLDDKDRDHYERRFTALEKRRANMNAQSLANKQAISNVQELGKKMGTNRPSSTAYEYGKQMGTKALSQSQINVSKDRMENF